MGNGRDAEWSSGPGDQRGDLSPLTRPLRRPGRRCRQPIRILQADACYYRNADRTTAWLVAGHYRAGDRAAAPPLVPVPILQQLRWEVTATEVEVVGLPWSLMNRASGQKWVASSQSAARGCLLWVVGVAQEEPGECDRVLAA